MLPDTSICCLSDGCSCCQTITQPVRHSDMLSDSWLFIQWDNNSICQTFTHVLSAGCLSSQAKPQNAGHSHKFSVGWLLMQSWSNSSCQTVVGRYTFYKTVVHAVRLNSAAIDLYGCSLRWHFIKFKNPTTPISKCKITQTVCKYPCSSKTWRMKEKSGTCIIC